jgi:hypothetical protein
MELDFSYLSTVEDCDALLKAAQEDKVVLGYKLTTLGFRKTTTAGSSSELEAELAEVNANLPGAIAALAALDEGTPSYKDALIRMKQLEIRQLLLERSLKTKGDVATGVRDIDIVITEMSLAEIDKATAMIEGRKTELLNAA